jgi:hydroxymethylpyrimidine pyrophosphatase-like HAD family hydrolase
MASANGAGKFDAVFCDVDGCLMPEGQEPADTAALGLVADYCRRSGRPGGTPVLVPCTGRPQPYVEAVCRLLGCRGLPAICENGVWEYDFAAHRWTMAPNITNEDLAAVRMVEEWVRRELGPRGCDLQLGKAASATVFHDDPEWLAAEAVPMLEELVAARGWPFRVSMTWTCINIDLSHVSKGHAIDRIVRRHGLERERVAGIGDTMGDLLMRERVGWFGCPANAAEELKPHADRVAREALARGVLELLLELEG